MTWGYSPCKPTSRIFKVVDGLINLRREHMEKVFKSFLSKEDMHKIRLIAGDLDGTFLLNVPRI